VAEEEARAAEAAVQAAAEEEEALATAMWNSSMAEALERCRRQDETSDRRSVRRAECVKHSRFSDGAGPSVGQ
jgi:hypothetical protein